MELDRLKLFIEHVDVGAEPHIEFIKKAQTAGKRLGVLASSFNPITIAHVELMRRAAAAFALDEMLALAGKTNADKTQYECSLEDRLAMLVLTFADDAQVSIGLASHAYFVDLVDALKKIYPRQTQLHFVLGFDTFERVLDREDRYTAKYHRRFSDRTEALRYLLVRSRLVVAGRAGAGRDDVHALLEHLPEGLEGRVLFLDFPAELSDRSATEVRNRLRAGLSIDGLVPPAVGQYIKERGLYRIVC